MVVVGLAVAILTVSVGPASAAKSRALSNTQKISAQLCSQSKGCVEWRASCRGPNRKDQWKCKVTNIFEDGMVCRIGLTWTKVGRKVRVAKVGKPRCA
jgi:hypothetical protein